MSQRIRDRPRWWPVPANTSMAVFGRIYIPRRLREELERTDPELLADIVEHETIHVARQHARGMLRWHLMYVFSRRFRWEEEKAAYYASLTRLRSRGGDLSEVERAALARRLSRWPYGFMTSAESARAFIDAVLAA